MSGSFRPAAGGRAVAAILAVWLASVGGAGCGAKRLSVGTSPFPAKTPVFLDDSGNPRVSLPRGSEPFRLLFLDFPWCPPCDGMWEGILTASKEFPPGTLRIDRVLFDRERLFPGGDAVLVPPLVPTPPRASGPVDSGGERVPLETWTAIPRAFREQFQFSRVPILLLLDGTGAVAARWAGASPSLAASLAGEIRKQTTAPPAAER